MNLNVNKNIENATEVITEKINKPPLGATPYWYTIKNRIEELANAILRYNDFSRNTKSIKTWAKEIVLYCELVERMKDI
jgi:hypothetical protein